MSDLRECTIKEESFSLTICGVERKGFVLESSWEGFRKYTNPEGSIIVTGGKATGIFSLFDMFAEDSRCTIVSASPCFGIEEDIKKAMA